MFAIVVVVVVAIITVLVVLVSAIASGIHIGDGVSPNHVPALFRRPDFDSNISSWRAAGTAASAHAVPHAACVPQLVSIAHFPPLPVTSQHRRHQCQPQRHQPPILSARGTTTRQPRHLPQTATRVPYWKLYM
jgi:hypothetical protein